MFRTNCSCRFTRLACSSQLALAAYCTHIIRRSLFYLFVNSTQRAESEGEEEEGGEGKRWRTVLGFEWHSQPRKTCTPLFTLGCGRTPWLRGRKGRGQHGLQHHSGMRPYTMVERTEGVRAAWPAAILTATFSLSTNTLLPLLEVKST